SVIMVAAGIRRGSRPTSYPLPKGSERRTLLFRPLIFAVPRDKPDSAPVRRRHPSAQSSLRFVQKRFPPPRPPSTYHSAQNRYSIFLSLSWSPAFRQCEYSK